MRSVPFVYASYGDGMMKIVISATEDASDGVLDDIDGHQGDDWWWFL